MRPAKATRLGVRLKALLFAVAIALAAPNGYLQSWDYVAVTHHDRKSGEWQTNCGKATVARNGRAIHIEVTFDGAEDFGPART
jgi:hypothetical protein